MFFFETRCIYTDDKSKHLFKKWQANSMTCSKGQAALHHVGYNSCSTRHQRPSCWTV